MSGGYSNMKCPKCESENTQRLEVAFNSGTQNINTTSNSAGIGFGSGGRIGFGGAVTKTSGQSQSALAASCAPPAKKPTKLLVIAGIVGVMFVSQVSQGLVGLTVLGLVIAGFSGYVGYTRHQYNLKEWPKLYQHWSESWLCHKCGGIYHLA
jgi:hypothetical protein